MAPKRRTASARSAPTNAQSKLSFSNKVTKSGAKQQATDSKKDPALVEDIIQTDVKPEDDPDLEEPTTTEKAIQQQVKDEASSLDTAPDPQEIDGDATTTESVLGGRAEQSDIGAIGGKASGWVADEEQQARKITDAQIKRYWRKKEEARLAPRVHQQDLTVYEKVLREWDMSSHFGPCIGIARLKRWKRANMLGLEPPIEVLAVLLKQMDAGDANSQRAHVDELMSSRFVAEP